MSTPPDSDLDVEFDAVHSTNESEVAASGASEGPGGPKNRRKPLLLLHSAFANSRFPTAGGCAEACEGSGIDAGSCSISAVAGPNRFRRLLPCISRSLTMWRLLMELFFIDRMSSPRSRVSHSSVQQRKTDYALCAIEARPSRGTAKTHAIDAKRRVQDSRTTKTQQRK